MTKTLTYIEVDVPLFDGDRFAGFDGSTWLTRGAGLTGAADSSQVTASFWVYPTDPIEDGRIIFGATSLGGTAAALGVQICFDSAGRIAITGNNSALTQLLDLRSEVLSLNEWSHVLISLDLTDATKRHIYLNDISAINLINVYTSGTMDFTLPDWSIGAAPAGDASFTGSLGDLWYRPGTYIDFSDEVNRRKFITAEGLPARLGATGATPTGATPLVYMSGAFDTWKTNKGTGGGFTATDTFSPIEGALTPAAEFLQTFRFAKPTDYLPNDIYAISSINNVSLSPALISLGETLGQRAKLTVSLTDHLHSFKGEDPGAGTFFGKWRGRYGTKLRGRAIRIIQGVLGQSIDEMDTRHYLIESTDGPTPSAVYTIQGQDVLKLADDDRSQAPIVSNGSLAGSINAATTAAALSPTGIGNLEYPASGWVCIGGKEVCSFTRVADALTIARGAFGSTAQAHNAGDRVQLVLRYPGNDIADVIYDLMTTYAMVPTSYINLTEWQAETAANLNVIYAATITETTSVQKLLNEIIQQAALAVWWDDRAQKIRLQVLREISTDTDTFTEDRIIAGSMSVKEQPDKRISQIWTYYGQRDPTDGGAKEDGFRAALATVDLETEDEYGTPMVVKIQARWIETLSAAERLGQIQISRFRDPPRNFSFAIAFDEDVALATGYQLEWWANQDEDGNQIPALIEVTKITRLSDRIEIEAEEMLASGSVILTHTVILIDQGALRSWTVPATWNNASNTISALAAGGGGFSPTGGNGGAGGGGGAFSQISNLTLTPGASVSYRVGTGGAAGVDGTDTWFNGATLAASSVGAKGGKAGGDRLAVGQGGQASAGVGTIKHSGGDGGTGGRQKDERGGGGGGGGAAGPNGNGAAAGNNAENDNGSGAGGGGADGGSVGQNTSGGGGSETPGNGGNNRFAFGAGTAAAIPTGQQGGGGAGDGGTGTGVGAGGSGEQQFTQTESTIFSAGPGGGGGGGRESSAANFGGAGGLYGGGGGGGGSGGGGGGPGAQGFIAITWREA